MALYQPYAVLLALLQACRYHRYHSDQPFIVITASLVESPAGCKEALAALFVELCEPAYAAAGHEGVDQRWRRNGRHGRMRDGSYRRHCQHVARVQQLA